MWVCLKIRSTAKSYGRFDGENYRIRSPIGFRGTSGRKQDDGLSVKMLRQACSFLMVNMKINHQFGGIRYPILLLDKARPWKVNSTRVSTCFKHHGDKEQSPFMGKTHSVWRVKLPSDQHFLYDCVVLTFGERPSPVGRWTRNCATWNSMANRVDPGMEALNNSGPTTCPFLIWNHSFSWSDLLTHYMYYIICINTYTYVCTYIHGIYISASNW